MKKNYIIYVISIIFIIVFSQALFLNSVTVPAACVVSAGFAVINFFLIISKVYNNSTKHKVIKYIMFIIIFALEFIIGNKLVTNSYIIYVIALIIVFLNSQNKYNGHIKFIFINLAICAVTYALVAFLGFDYGIFDNLVLIILIYFFITLLIFAVLVGKKLELPNLKTAYIICGILMTITIMLNGIELVKIMSLSKELNREVKALNRVTTAKNLEEFKSLIYEAIKGHQKDIEHAKEVEHTTFFTTKTVKNLNGTYLSIAESYKTNLNSKKKLDSSKLANSKESIKNIAETIDYLNTGFCGKVSKTRAIMIAHNLVCMNVITLLALKNGKKNNISSDEYNMTI